ncbi:MAG TPA: efflux transporter periplasmic adaptor subunit, partial [Rhodocyclaceae bacterium]|nr:efflux transporter periplasmic adaptor subunit [Rhodocyclaceae bacterium]
SGTDWLVNEGLKEGDKVIVNGLQKIKPGAVVSLKPWSAEAEKAANQPAPAPAAAPAAAADKAQEKPQAATAAPAPAQAAAAGKQGS